MNKTISLIGAILISGLIFSCTNKCSENQSKEERDSQAEQTFIDWGKQNAVPILSLKENNDNTDLEAIAKSIGNARVVAISEGFHNCKEMMQLNQRLIQYLVKEKGFNTVITESGMPESRMVYDYIKGKQVNGNVHKEGYNKMYGAWKEGQSLINWMREYNKSHNNILDYMGADIGGFYTNWYPPIKRIVDYLQKVDSKEAKSLNNKLKPFLKIMGKTKARKNYQDNLTAEQKAKLAIILDNTVKLFKDNKESYIAKWNKEEYEWARLSSVAMRMTENYYRNYGDKCEEQPNRYAGLNGRELMMSYNVLQRLQIRKDAKMILINHVVHTKTKSQKQDDVWDYFTPMAQIIKENLKDDFFIIGMCYGGGKFWNKWQRPAERFIDTIQNYKKDGIEATMSSISKKAYFLHWEKAPLKAEPWLNKETTLRENDYYMKMEPIEWNACLYLNEVSPATAAE